MPPITAEETELDGSSGVMQGEGSRRGKAPCRVVSDGCISVEKKCHRCLPGTGVGETLTPKRSFRVVLEVMGLFCGGCRGAE